jgi:transcription factor AP-1
MYNNGAMAARNMTLDLNNGKVGNGNCKRARITVSASVAAPVLTTPDVQMLKMTSPELAKFLSAGHNVSTPTPFPKTVTEEQELYARGFEDALNTVKSKLNSVPQPVALVSVKEEFDHDDDAGSSVSSSSSSAVSGVSPLSPINMEVQESAKLERKRARNREAAARCRKRKLERISCLDERVNDLKEENADLASVVKRLRASVCQLKQEVMEHVSNGCQIHMVAEEESGTVAY